MASAIYMDKQILIHIQAARYIIGAIIDGDIGEDDQGAALLEAWDNLDKILGFVIE